jgi:hypothetical protein
MASAVGTVAALWRGPGAALPPQTRNYERLRPIFAALHGVGVAVEPVLYCDATSDVVREQLVRVDGVLVWVDPIGEGEDRTTLDAVLRDVSSHGVWVSAHPDTIEKMGTKEVLYRTKNLEWGTDTHLYATNEEFRRRFPAVLGTSRRRVLKPNRGNGGIGVWKVALVDLDGDSTASTVEAIVRVQHAAPRTDVTEDVTLGEFMSRCGQYFTDARKLVDQAFIAGVSDGMVRAYLVGDEVVGFARQHPSLVAAGEPVIAADDVLGLPSAKVMYDADADAYQELRDRLEAEWVPGLCQQVGLDSSQLPLLWDADFLPGPMSPTGVPTYLLCEINVSSVLPYPPQAPRVLAEAVRRRLERDAPP